MLSPDKRDRLKSFLLGLDAQELRSLTRTIEYGRQISEGDLPSDEILKVIRPALSGIHPEHLPTVPRVLCDVCEDLFVPGEEEEKRPGHIPRSIIQPYTNATRSLVGASIDKMEQGMLAAFVSKSWDELAVLKADFWAYCSQAWLAKISAGVDDAFRAQFGGPDGIENLKEAVLCLRASDSIMTVRRILPEKQSDAMDAAQLTAMIERIEMVATSSPGDTGVVLWSAFRRLRDPQDVKPLLERMSLSTVAWPSSATAARDGIEAVLEEVEAEAAE
ncbi:MAG: hypothetical protein RIM33_13905 [Alphaproteobacteria bacterium]